MKFQGKDYFRHREIMFGTIMGPHGEGWQIGMNTRSTMGSGDDKNPQDITVFNQGRKSPMAVLY